MTIRNRQTHPDVHRRKLATLGPVKELILDIGPTRFTFSGISRVSRFII